MIAHFKCLCGEGVDQVLAFEACVGTQSPEHLSGRRVYNINRF